MLRELRAALAQNDGSGGGSAGGGGAAGEGGALLRAIHVRRASAYRVWRRQQAQLREREGEGGGAAQWEAHDEEEEDAPAGVAETARVVAAGRRGEGRGALALDLLSLGDWLQLVLACLEASLDLPGTVR